MISVKVTSSRWMSLQTAVLFTPTHCAVSAPATRQPITERHHLSHANTPGNKRPPPLKSLPHGTIQIYLLLGYKALLLFLVASRTLRDATQEHVVTFLSVTKKNCAGGPIADQSQSAVRARGHPALCHLCGRIAAHRLEHP